MMLKLLCRIHYSEKPSYNWNLFGDKCIRRIIGRSEGETIMLFKSYRKYKLNKDG